jgi:hypothetical protein
MAISQTVARVFRWPVILAFMTLVGLVGSLMADGIWDVIGWVLIGAPTLAGLYFWFVPRPVNRVQS